MADPSPPLVKRVEKTLGPEARHLLREAEALTNLEEGEWPALPNFWQAFSRMAWLHLTESMLRSAPPEQTLTEVRRRAAEALGLSYYTCRNWYYAPEGAA